MILKNLSLVNFRNYQKSQFNFDSKATVFVGPNASGKTNLIESIHMLATGKSFRTDKEKQLLQFGEKTSRIKGEIGVSQESIDGEELEVVLIQTPPSAAIEPRFNRGNSGSSNGGLLQKKYLVNSVSKRRVDFAGRIPVVLFTPTDIDIVIGQPSTRRRFLDEVLEQVDREYSLARDTYTKALRQRNALLEQTRMQGQRKEKLFSYWDNLLIQNGEIITQKREELLSFINQSEKEIFPFVLTYDKSIISQERLLQYKDAEVGAGVTLVGPHRDEILIQSNQDKSKEILDVKHFSSRGQQRLVTLELKLSQISYIQQRTQSLPVLLLDDIFSELDSQHIEKILKLIGDYQTIMTTTHKEFIEDAGLKNINIVELERNTSRHADI